MVIWRGSLRGPLSLEVEQLRPRVEIQGGLVGVRPELPGGTFAFTGELLDFPVGPEVAAELWRNVSFLPATGMFRNIAQSRGRLVVKLF